MAVYTFQLVCTTVERLSREEVRAALELAASDIASDDIEVVNA
jgi:hypothetical protein